MTNPKLDGMRADIEREIKGVEDQLTVLRSQRTEIAAKIKDKVAEQTELRSALSRLTSRRGRKAAQPVAETEAAVDQ